MTFLQHLKNRELKFFKLIDDAIKDNASIH